MKKKILKSMFVCTLALFALCSGVKGEDDKKKPIVMQQYSYAEELEEDVVADQVEDDASLTDGDVVEYESDDKLIFVRVCGKAKSQVSPDSAVIFSRIETLENDISLSKESNYNIFEKVVSQLEEKGLSKDEIKLEYFNCQPSYDYSSGRTLNGYYSTTAFSVYVNDLQSLDAYFSALTDAGVTSIDNVCYKVSSMEDEYNNVLKLAVENARAKAETMLGCDNLTLAKIKEECVCSAGNFMKSSLDGTKLSSFLGKMEIEAQVLAEFVCE